MSISVLFPGQEGRQRRRGGGRLQGQTQAVEDRGGGGWQEADRRVRLQVGRRHPGRGKV